MISDTDIAIIGMTVRCPKAPDLNTFWENLRNGVEAISVIPDEDLESSPFGALDQTAPNFIRTGFFLDGIDLFDAGFFGIPAAEAELMDPQHRLFLECAWEAMENAGYDLTNYPGSVAVYAGSTDNAYLLSLVLQGISPIESYQVLTGNRKDHVATRVSYKLGLTGESINVQTTCSTSLVAVHLACQSLLNGQCEVALAGGVAVQVPQKTGYLYQQDMILSPDGHCRAFDSKAQGTNFGNGLGIVVLKPLKEAVGDRDHIYAVIKGSAINNDGKAKVGYTAPSVEGQASVITMALEFAGVSADTISYLEAHGTGTALGDPIEIEALTQVFRQYTEKKGFCAIGSVKTNVGHLDAAAGVVGLIKTALSLYHKEIPPSLNFEKPNPIIDFESSPFYINTRLANWNWVSSPRRAGVSSFGIGGTNAHVILEEPPIIPPDVAAIERPLHLLTLSAKSDAALRETADQYHRYLLTQSLVSLADCCFTANVGRVHFQHRLAFIASSSGELKEELLAFHQGEATDRDNFWTGQVSSGKHRIAFLFTGQGSQYANMGKSLYATQPTFRQAIDRCEEFLRPHLHGSLLNFLYPPAGPTSPLDQTWIVQPALFALEYALAQLWLSWGIRPAAVLGHSFGEYVAACIAGTFSLEDGLALVVQRGRLMEAALGEGMMAIAFVNEDAIGHFLEPFHDRVSIAAVNGFENTVISGERSAIRDLMGQLEAADILTYSLDSPYAFHSPLVDSILDSFEQIARSVEFKPLQIPLVSNLTGRLLESGTVLDANYWRQQARAPVQYSLGVASLAEAGFDALVEVGPQPILLTLGKRVLPESEILWLSSLERGRDDWSTLLSSLARLYVAGVEVDWGSYDKDYLRRRVPLPTYPFERRHYWIEMASSERIRTKSSTPELGMTVDSPTVSVSSLRSNTDLGPVAQAATEVEREVIRIWKNTMGLDDLSSEDNFFYAGGDSVLAIQMLSQLRKVFQVEIPIDKFFDGPTVTKLSEQIATQLKHQHNQEDLIIKPVSRDQELPLSFAQQRLWFLDKLVPDNPFYNIASAIRITGQLDISVLEHSLNEIVQRHEALRTTFPSRTGRAIQVIAPTLHLSIPIIDLSDLPGFRKETEVKRLVVQDSRQTFDLARGPLVRATLLRLAPGQHIALLTMHHIVSDGWSMGVLIRELGVLYDAFLRGAPSPLPELPIQYGDFAIWQRGWLRQDALGAQIRYWKETLAGAPKSLRLPSDHPRPAIQTFRGARYRVVLSKSLSEAVKAFSRKENVTLFTTLLAAFKVLLYRYTAQEDIVVGSPISNRNRAEIDSLIGFFVNTLALRTNLSGNPAFRELVHRVREVVVGSLLHQDLPFERLVEELQPERNLSSNPLFQVNFAFQNAPRNELSLSDLTVEVLEIDNGTTRFDLALEFQEGSEGLTGFFEYSTDLFNAATIARMAEHFEMLLNCVVTDPDQFLSDLPHLTKAEKHLMLAEWNNAPPSVSRDVTVQRLFEAQVARTPEAIAVITDKERLTYDELNRRSNTLAHHLQGLGVGPDVCVAIGLERSVALVVGIWGILKAGGAYVPLDLTYPRERLAYMIRDSHASVLLTEQGYRAQLQQLLDGLQIICLDSAQPMIDQEAEENPVPTSKADNLAYVIYTSGSTGQPKGVAVTQHGLANYLTWCTVEYAVAEGYGAPVHSAIGFDLTVTSLFPALLVGKSIVLLPEDDGLEALSKVLSDKRDFSLVKITPSHLDILAQRVSPSKAKGSTRALIIGGETLREEQLSFWRTHAPEVRLINEYGPTETVVGCCVFEAPVGLALPGVVPIGRPIAGTRLYVFDQYLHLLPIGVPGELYIGGAGVARGYLNRPDLTAESFIPDPFSDQPGARLYKTGDLVRYLPDGNLEFLGRVDFQVKIRGHRVELGEIETRLWQHPAVKEVVVLALDDGSGDKRLVAYLVIDQPIQNTDQQELAERLSEWQAVFEGSYSHLSPYPDPLFNTAGWQSSYTGLAFVEEEMREWVDHAVERVLSLQPDRVLEVGCGTGLLLFRIAPHCSRYLGTDFSEAALSYTQRTLAVLERELPNVVLSRRAADDFDGLSERSFDTVILNSVIQYFPNIDYLLRVLESAVNVVEPGGTVFVGDVRSLPLLEVFCTSVLLHQSPASLTKAQLRQRVRRRTLHEQELVVDPAFFHALKIRLPRISHVEVHLKRGHYHNELTRFRYDAILYIECKGEVTTDHPWLDWSEQKLSLEELYHSLESGPELLGIVRIPNARLLAELKTVEWLAYNDGPNTVGEMLKIQNSTQLLEGVDPEDLWSLANQFGYDVAITWSKLGGTGYYDVVFKRPPSSTGRQKQGLTSFFPLPETSGQDWHTYANNPILNRAARMITTELHAYLRERLPDYMMPSNFITLDEIPLTANGKVDRQALPLPDQARPEIAGAYVSPRTQDEATLAEVWVQVLGIEQVGIHDKFFELGGDSILSIQVIARANQAGLRLTPKMLFQHQTIAELAAMAAATPVVETEQGFVTGRVLLTPIQRWFLQQNQPEPHHYNQAVLLELRQPLSLSGLERAVQHLVDYHDALRLRYQQNESGWEQFNASIGDAVPVKQVDLSANLVKEQDAIIQAVATEEQTRLDLSAGPIVRVVLFDLGRERLGRLLIVIHHLAVDSVSWRILLEDLETAYGQFSRDEAFHLPPKTTSYQYWAEQLVKYAQFTDLERECKYWLSMPWVHDTRIPLSHEPSRGPNTMASTRTVSVSLEAEQTNTLLHTVSPAYGAQVNEVLLTALLFAFERWAGGQTLMIDLEGHGREEDVVGDVDLSRTVGWFTTLYPVFLSKDESATPRESLRMVQEQLRRIPQRGLAYGLLRYIDDDSPAAWKLRALPQADIVFNYLGQFDQIFTQSRLFKPARESSGPARSPQYTRPYLLEIDAGIVNGKLSLLWTYSDNFHTHGSIEAFSQMFLKELWAMSTSRPSRTAYSRMLSDFTRTTALKEKLDVVSALYNDTDEMYPLAPNQKAMLLKVVHAPRYGQSIYQTGFTLLRPLDLSLFEQAWQRAVKRHPQARLSFVWDELDEPIQVTHNSEAPVREVDVRELSSSEQQERFSNYLQTIRERGFDLTKPPLIDLTVFRMADAVHRLAVSFSLLAFDVPSFALLMSDTLSYYEGLYIGQIVELEQPPSYKTHSQWVRTQDHSPAREFWQDYLAGFRESLPIVSYPGPRPGGKISYIHESSLLSKKATLALQSLAKKYQITLSTLLQGVWAVLLSQHTGRNDVVFGVNISTRPAGYDKTVGCFVNTVPVRVQLPSDGPFLSLLKNHQGKLLEILQYGHHGAEQIAAWIGFPETEPLFHSIFVWEDISILEYIKERYEIDYLDDPVFVPDPEAPLRVLAEGSSRGLNITLSYIPDYFDPVHVKRMQNDFVACLALIVRNPGVDVSRLPPSKNK